MDAAVGAVDCLIRLLELSGTMLLGLLSSLRQLADSVQEGHIGSWILFILILIKLIYVE